MSRGLSVVIFIAQESRQRKAAINPCFQPILGQIPLKLAINLAERVKPEGKIILIPRGTFLPAEWMSSGWKAVEAAEGQDFGSFFRVVSEAIARRKKTDILFLSPRFPLIKARSLRRLVENHRLSRAALSYFCLSYNTQEGKKEKKSGAGILSSFPALVIDKEKMTGPDGPDKEKLAFLARFKTAKDLLNSVEAMGWKTTKVILDQEENFDLGRYEEKAAIVALLRREKIGELISRGVVFLDPGSVWVDLKVSIGAGSVISPGVVIEGASRLAREVTVYPFVHIIDSRIGQGAKILSASMIEGSRLEPEVQVGPFAHLRPGTVVKAGARIGNFVEMKKTVFGRGSKAMHLSYLGDSKIGDNVNIGAGTITCNYDGQKKHETIIESGAFIGSGTELVAPVKIGRRAYVGAGSTITRNVSPDSLAVARARQVEIPEWARKRRNK